MRRVTGRRYGQNSRISESTCTLRGGVRLSRLPGSSRQLLSGLACVLGRDRGSRYWLPIMPSGRLKCGPVNIGSSSRPRSFYAGLSVTCLAIAFGTVVVFRGRDVVRVRDEAESDDRQ